jgi:hypothetical protein
VIQVTLKELDVTKDLLGFNPMSNELPVDCSEGSVPYGQTRFEPELRNSQLIPGGKYDDKCCDSQRSAC